MHFTFNALHSSIIFVPNMCFLFEFWLKAFRMLTIIDPVWIGGNQFNLSHYCRSFQINLWNFVALCVSKRGHKITTIYKWIGLQFICMFPYSKRHTEHCLAFEWQAFVCLHYISANMLTLSIPHISQAHFLKVNSDAWSHILFDLAVCLSKNTNEWKWKKKT